MREYKENEKDTKIQNLSNTLRGQRPLNHYGRLTLLVAFLSMFWILFIPQLTKTIYADPITVNDEEQLREALSNASIDSEHPTEIVIDHNISSSGLSMPSNRYAEIDLNGMRLEFTVGGFNVYGNLTVKDTGTTGTMIIADSADLVQVIRGCFTLEGGTLRLRDFNNYCICVLVLEGTFIMNGGQVTATGSNHQSVQVGNGASFTQNGGAITGPIIVDASGTYTHNGGTNDDYVSVTFNANGGSGDMYVQYVQKNTPTALTANTFTWNGHTFKGWSESDTATSATYIDEESVTITENKQLYAVWEEDAPTTYQLNVTKEGEGTVTPSSGQKTPGTTVNLTATPATNYAFVRWDATGVTISNPTTATNSFTMPSNVVTVKAIFKPIPATPVISPGTQTYTSAQDVTITCATSGATIKYYLGDTEPATPSTYSSTINISASTKLTAWSEKDGVKSSRVTATYTISPSSSDHNIYVENDGHGTGTATPSNCSNDTEVQLSATPAGGYEFDCWTTENEIRIINPRSSSEAYFSMIDQDVTVKANFKPVSPTEKCTITFDKNGGLGTMNPQQVNKGTATKLRKNTFTRNGYEFKNWNTKSDGSGTSYADEDNITTNTDMTLYSQWKKDEPDPTPTPRPRPRPKDDDDDDLHESEPATSNNNNIKASDGCEELRQLLANAAASGKPQTVKWNKGTSLPADVILYLHNNPNLTLEFTYTYGGG